MFFKQEKKQTANKFQTISDGFNLTISIININDFVSLAEEVEAEKLYKTLNKYHLTQQTLIKQASGFVEMSAPDEVKGYWGIDKTSNHAMRACECALRQLSAIAELNESLQKEGLQPINVRIGINTGETLVSINEQESMIIGESVSLASYTCDLAKKLGKAIMITENTEAQLDDSINFVVNETERLVRNARDCEAF